VIPDSNDLDMNPYSVEAIGMPLGYEYAIEINFQDEEESAEELLALVSVSYIL
jgi:hypothetical protein